MTQRFLGYFESILFSKKFSSSCSLLLSSSLIGEIRLKKNTYFPNNQRKRQLIRFLPFSLLFTGPFILLCRNISRFFTRIKYNALINGTYNVNSFVILITQHIERMCKANFILFIEIYVHIYVTEFITKAVSWV